MTADALKNDRLGYSYQIRESLMKDILSMRFFVFFLSLCFLLPPLAEGQAIENKKPEALSQLELKLREVRSDLRLDNRKLTGGAVPLLKDAIRDAHYVLIGEDHITREIPLFTESVCDVISGRGCLSRI
jgi:hypothetical protein